MPNLADYSLAFVDLETTGGHAVHDRITEVAVIEVEGATVREGWSTLVDPGRSIPPEIQVLTGITPERVAGQPAFEAIADDLYARLQGRVLVAHNARFDYGFLKNAFKRLGQVYTPRVLCTVRLSRHLNPERPSHRLDLLLDVYGLQCKHRHRAFDDAQVLWDLLKAWIDEHGIDRVTAAIEAVTRHPALPPHLSPDQVDALPSAPGVYLFYGKNDVLLYIGKSVNIRTRVQSHFAADHSDMKEHKLSQQVRRIEALRTGGDLGAQLLEARLIKLRQPLYNRRLRRHQALVYLRLAKNAQGYFTLQPHIDRDRNDPDPDALIGPFRSRRAAQETLRAWVGEHQLCQRLLGLDKRKSGACFGYQLKKCRGACCGEEPPETYNRRLRDVAGEWQIKAWPHDGPITIRESSQGVTEYHLIDQWRHLDTQARAEALSADGSLPHGFDYDIYKILLRTIGGGV